MKKKKKKKKIFQIIKHIIINKININSIINGFKRDEIKNIVYI